jgi:hypothetical protein
MTDTTTPMEQWIPCEHGFADKVLCEICAEVIPLKAALAERDAEIARLECELAAANARIAELRGITCDSCNRPATRWFLDTAVRICDSGDCYQDQLEMFNAAIDAIKEGK